MMSINSLKPTRGLDALSRYHIRDQIIKIGEKIERFAVCNTGQTGSLPSVFTTALGKEYFPMQTG